MITQGCQNRDVRVTLRGTVNIAPRTACAIVVVVAAVAQPLVHVARAAGRMRGGGRAKRAATLVADTRRRRSPRPRVHGEGLGGTVNSLDHHELIVNQAVVAGRDAR